MVRHYYIDESGHTGDLATTDAALTFGRQPIFTLAVVGLNDEAAFGEELERLKAEHRVQAAELKASHVESKPGFVRDLVERLERRDLPLLIEVVDKRFMIAVNMVEWLFGRQIGRARFDPRMRKMMNVMAEYTAMRAPPNVFGAYAAACRATTTAAVGHVFGEMLRWLREEADEVGVGMCRMTADTYDEFTELSVDEGKVLRRFLPESDIGLGGQPVWMLPNLSSLMSIYARINRLHGGDVGAIRILHDEQKQYGHILQQAKSLAESLSGIEEIPRFEFADYDFRMAADLTFGVSHQSPGIQAADVLGGFVMRYVKGVLCDRSRPPEEAKRAFMGIVDFFERGHGQGINFVIPTQGVFTLGLIPR